VAAYGPEPEIREGRRQLALAAAVTLLAVSIPYFSEVAQQRIALTLQATALRPFIATQGKLAEARIRADQIDQLQAELDSLTSIAATQSALVQENQALRELLGLARRAGPNFLSATVVRSGTTGSESMFMVDRGAEDGVRVGAPVVSARGLVGVIREVRPRIAVGMDWAHPDFRVSGMLVDGSAFGIVENVRGAFREADRLLLNGTAYHVTVPEGELVITSGLAGLLPRGLPIGTIEATAEVQGSWLKSYWLRPAVELGSVTHVLVESASGSPDLSYLWPADSVDTGVDAQRGPES
jgi:rod shape-determining protein MreC